MKRLVFRSTLLSALCLAFVAAGAVLAQEKKEMTVEWIYSKEAKDFRKIQPANSQARADSRHAKGAR